jgi:hypothetical protein
MQLQWHREIREGQGWLRVGPQQTNCTKSNQERKPSNLEGKRMGTLQSDEDSRMWERGREAGTTNAGNIEHRACCIRSGWNKVAKFEVPCQWKGVCCRGASRQQLPKPPRACLIALSHPWAPEAFPQSIATGLSCPGRSWPPGPRRRVGYHWTPAGRDHIARLLSAILFRGPIAAVAIRP